MLRSFLAFAFVLLAARAPVWAQQQAPQEPQPVPDTKPARERHRVQEKLPPPPEGPWGAEDFDFTWLNPVYRGIFADVQSYSATGIELNVPHGVQGFSDGVSETLIQKLSWHDENFRSIGGRVLLDLDMIRISAG
ncbi:MAG TPA: hypothetical protein VKW04_02505, partial [Planctomycetota bacterium]|nr:hypothetical protein [Planctomycetota bacterium]